MAMGQNEDIEPATATGPPAAATLLARMPERPAATTLPGPGARAQGRACIGRPVAGGAADRNRRPAGQPLSGQSREVAGTRGGDGLEKLQPVPVRVAAVE